GLGGGDRGDQACLQVIIDGSVVASATGSNSEPIVTRFLDLEAHRGKEATLVIKDDARGAWGHLNCDAIWFTDREDTLFENWDQGFQGWTTTGTAFGKGPVTAAETPEDFRRPVGIRTDLNVQGNFATSFNFRGNGDGEQGTLTSAEFTIDRRFVTAWVGGGSHREQTCLNVIIGDDVVATATGTDIEPVTAISMDVGRHRGKKARIQIVDAHTGGWGHINVDRIIFSDRPVRRLPVARRPDGGSFALGLLDREASDVAVTVRPSITAADTPDGLFDGPEAPLEVDGATPQVGTVSTRFTLAAREDRTVRFAFGWFFPTLRPEHFTQLVDGAKLRREYVNRFDSARAVVDHVATEVERLTAATRAWVTAWYEDSTLPHWFLERTLATAATLATSTCYRRDKGRFYAWEGTYCCTGTCQHVWNYAQAIGRLFPALERDTRERVDLGVAFRENGEMGNRGEGGDLTRDAYADGQCGTILRFYREHQMSPDKRFLERNWTKIKKSVEFVVDQFDGAEGDAIDGILRGSQWNTLDGAWFGEIPWLSGLYIASLRAAAAMAGEIGDDAAVQRWTTVAEQGSAFLSSQLFNPDYGYFVHRVDPVRKGAANTNRGCHIDQMYGQTYASQLGLPRVFDQDQSRTALGKLYANNFLTDPGSYRPPGIGPSRVFATKDEPGVIMTTWPYGGSDESGGHGYFNEVWTGQEHQFAAHLFAEGLTAEGLAVTKAIHDRHHGSKRNPYNEIEASDHYARAMMGFGVYLAAIGYEYHGPKGHLGFAPRIGPEDFRGAFTAAEGWGSYRQTRGAGQLKAEIEVRYGKLRLVTLAFQTDGPAQAVTVTHQGQPVPAELKADGSRSLVTLGSPMVIASGASLKVELT
ncbi:MAG: non-lysosomal glucosylceramidase, partial [Propionibacteriales bacterium]|nr:non-lysosomal glucosylceramidase [Propionibacteriales bacterium]